MCSPEVHDISHHPPPTLRQLSAPPHTVSIGFSGAYSSTCCAPNRHSNPIVHRVRRKRQRLPPSLLIENASERLPLPTRSVMPRRFRSRLATTRPELPSAPLPSGLSWSPAPEPRGLIVPLPKSLLEDVELGSYGVFPINRCTFSGLKNCSAETIPPRAIAYCRVSSDFPRRAARI